MRRFAAGLAIVVCATVVAVAASGSPSTFSAHPRIFLSPATLSALRQRAAANSSSWKALKAECDLYLTGTVEWPDGIDYPDTNSIGEGYQGSGYFAAIANLGLCYQIVRVSNPVLAAKYAEKAVDVLTKMSAPYGAGQHGENPLRDSGYGVRFYSTGMALGFDWLYPALSATLKARLDTSENTWLTAFATGGFERGFPQGNYFAGYYTGKAFTGLALSGETTHGTIWWNGWLTTLHNGMVQPYYAANLSGGGWPEGWNYGPFGTLNMSWPALAAKTGASLDLVHESKPYAFPLASARYLLHFTWPDLKTMDDDGLIYDGDNPSAARPSFFGDEAGLLEGFGDSFAPVFHSFAQAVRAAAPAEGDGADVHLWENFLFWNPSAATSSYKSQPRSFLAQGMDRAAVRSAWSRGAVWASFMGGPHTNNPDAGEEFPDKGSLAIVRGGRPLLVNTWGALLRNTPGTSNGAAYFSPLYNDVFYGKRDIFNIFYAGRATPGQGAYLRSNGNRSAMTRFEDGGSYVAMRASRLEDNYPQNSGATKPIASWTRDVVYLRPELFAVYDRTRVRVASVPQWMSFHLGGRAHAAVARVPGIRRFDVGRGRHYAGTVETVLPTGQVDKVKGLFGHHKVDRLTVKPTTRSAQNRWLTVLDAASAPRSAVRARPLRVKRGSAVGVVLQTRRRNFVVVAGKAAAGRTIRGRVQYALPAARTLTVVLDLRPRSPYRVRARRTGRVLRVSLRRGRGVRTSGTGVLAFRTSSAGAVSPASR